MAETMWRDCEQLARVRGKKVLCVGSGGGCDVVTAYAFAKFLEKNFEPREVSYANCIGPRDTHPLVPLLPTTPNILHPPPHIAPVEIRPDVDNHGTVSIEMSLPRGGGGSPYVMVCAKQERGVQVQEVTERNRVGLGAQVASLKFDIIFVVDTGGDSLTGGVDFKYDVALGRDRQMLAMFSDVGSQMCHVVFGPGCDGETNADVMGRVLDFLEKKHQIEAVIPLEEFEDTFRTIGPTLAPNRTPNIMLSALDHPDQTHVTINRNIRPVIPREWLVRVYLVRWEGVLSPSLPQLDGVMRGEMQ